MNNITEIINTINKISSISNVPILKLTEACSSLSTFLVNNNVNKETNILNSTKNLCEYVDNLYSKIDNVNNMYNSHEILENINNTEELYNNMENSLLKVVHSGNTSTPASYTDFYSNFVDKSENFADNHNNSVDNSNFIHNSNDFKEIYSFVDNISRSDTTTQNYSSKAGSNININLGGVTQNITEANCNNVLEELSEILIRALSGCDGTY